MQRFRSLIGVGNALPAGESREAYAAGLAVACADPEPEPENWQALAYSHAREVARLRAALAEHVRSAPTTVDKQAGAILRNLEAWCSDKPGRGFRAVRASDGSWRASLIECERRTANGENLADALGQIATVASYELE